MDDKRIKKRKNYKIDDSNNNSIAVKNELKNSAKKTESFFAEKTAILDNSAVGLLPAEDVSVGELLASEYFAGYISEMENQTFDSALRFGEFELTQSQRSGEGNAPGERFFAENNFDEGYSFKKSGNNSVFFDDSDDKSPVDLFAVSQYFDRSDNGSIDSAAKNDASVIDSQKAVSQVENKEKTVKMPDIDYEVLTQQVYDRLYAKIRAELNGSGVVTD